MDSFSDESWHMVETQIAARGIVDRNVLDAMRTVPREMFVPASLIGTVDPDVLGRHAGHGDFSRWVLGVFDDQALTRQLSKTEARWRRGELGDLRAALDRLIAARYGSEGEGTGEIGREAVARESGP